MAIDTSMLAFPKAGKGQLRVETKRTKRLTLAQQERLCRRKVRERDCGRCRVCDHRAVHLHHLERRSRGGKWLTTNIVALCAECHGYAHGAVLYLSGNPDVSLYWEWLDRTGPPKPWGYSRPPADIKGLGDRWHGQKARRA